MPKDFFDIVNNYDPTQDVANLAMKKFTMDMEKQKFDMAMDKAKRDEAHELEKIASKKQGMDYIKSLITPKEITSPEFGMMDNPQATGLDAVTGNTITKMVKPEMPSTKEILANLVGMGAADAGTAFEKLLTAEKGGFKLSGNLKNGLVGYDDQGNINVLREPTQTTEKDYKPASDVGKMIADRDALKAKGFPADHPDVASLDERIKKANDRPVDAKKELARNTAFTSKQAIIDSMDTLETKVQHLIDHPGLKGITGIKGSIPDIPGSDAANARAALLSITAQLGLNTLTDLKKASGTGLGSVTEAEHKLLQNYLTALSTSQDTKTMKDSLKGILDWSKKAKTRLDTGYERLYGDKAQQSEAPPSGFTKTSRTSGGKPVWVSSDGKSAWVAP